jgi:sialate O-acetylesterase
MRCLSPFVALLTALSLQAGDLKISTIFSDHGVLQAGDAAVYGRARSNAKVEVTFGKQTVTTQAAENGIFKVSLKGLKPTEEGEDLVVKSGEETYTAHDVIVGEVWLASGQSNIDMVVNGTFAAKTAVARPRDNGLRIFLVGRIPAAQPVEDVKGSWKIADPTTVPGFSATSYYFAYALRQDMKQPVGVIVSSIGGTRAEAWGPKGVYDEVPEAKGWEEKEAAGVKARADKHDPKNPPVWSNGPHMNWNGMIYPLIGYTFKGALWYQGESNAGHGEDYKWVLGAMIKSWHKDWGSDFPFMIVQLPRFMAKKPLPVEEGWAKIRESMEWISDNVPGAMMTVNIDLGDEKDIHPKDKLEIGQRLAALALQRVYKLHDIGSAPRVVQAKLQGDAWVLTYDRPVVLRGEGKGFAVLGADGKWSFAQAKVDGKTVTVSAEGVKAPTEVRYAWTNFPEVSVYSAAEDGLPAGPWRSSK